MRFRAIVELAGKSATGITVPPEVVAGLGSSKKPAVRVTINGFTYRSTVATMGGQFKIPVSAEIRKGAGIGAGDEVLVDIELDTEPREVSVPADFTEALDHDAEARRQFNELSYSNKRRYVLSIEDAKTAETRQRRIAKAVSELARHGGSSV
jgi:bifunctional DNA-binding transcriptional regulator/antitoxin component of YhaV-PrlF toxin-antitoxin module